MSYDAHGDAAAEADDSRAPLGSHAYLGELQDVDRVTHSLFPEGAVVRLPLVFLPDIVLFPGDELPLRLLSPVSVDAIRTHLAGGTSVLAVLCDAQQGPVAYGTTVRVEKFSVVNSVASVTGVAKQRFRVTTTRPSASVLGDVEILAHPSAPRLPCPLANMRGPQNASQRRLTAQQFTGYWGRHAYALFDVQRLVTRIQRAFASSAQWFWFGKAPSSPAFVHPALLRPPDGSRLRFLTEPSDQLDASVFAYWVAGNLPLERTERLELLQMDCVVRLLRREVAILSQCSDNFYCASCGAFLAHTRDLFSMTSHGAAGTFVNPSGLVFQLLTLRDVHPFHVVVDVVRSTEDSWFPGFAWSITYCNACYAHLGWQFDAVTAAALLAGPGRFFGFRRAALTTSPASAPHAGEYNDEPEDGEYVSEEEENSDNDVERRDDIGLEGW